MKKEIRINLSAEELFDLRWMLVKEVQRTLDDLDIAIQQEKKQESQMLRQKAERLNDLHEELCRFYNENFED